MILRSRFCSRSQFSALLLSVCCATAVFAQGDPAAAPPAGGAPPAAGAATAARPPDPAPKPYKDVIQGAKEIPGFFKLWRKDEKVWIELAPDQLEKPFFFSWNIPSSIGERGFYASQMGGSEVALFRKIGNQIQLIAKNTEFFAAAGTPQAQFVSESYSDSLLASAGAASLPHPETKAVLVEANALLLADIPGYLTRLEAAFRVPYALDAKNSSITRVNNTPLMTGVRVSAHYAVPKFAPPPLTPPPVPLPPPPRSLPDPRSMFVGFYYSFSRFPEQAMAPRLADERIGHFATSRIDYTEDLSPKLRVHYVDRWRIEKKDPGAALSDAKEPVVYWLDKNIPEKYRKAVADGVLEWNKAFEKIGIRGALAVRQQDENDDFDTMDARHASIRWFTGLDIGFAIGPSQVDPRSGEILDADIGMSDVFARGARRLVAEDIGKPAASGFDFATSLRDMRNGIPACDYAAEAAPEAQFAMDLLEARGIEMDSPEAEKLAQARVKDVIMHEVGHTLGLRHNFRASTVYSLRQIENPEFTRVNGVTGSVMDYTPFNLAPNGEKQGEYVMSTLGPYDYWAIEYAYRPIAAAQEKEELARIASRSTEPLLAYATDEDAGFGSVLIGIDPDVNRFDLGGDPIEYYKRRMMLSRELWDRIGNLQLKPGESYERLTRSFVSGFAQLARIAPLAAKYVGGVRHLRDRAGTGRPLYDPTPVARQREALTLITNDLLRVNSFRFKPEFVSRIGIDQFERPANPDISIATAVLNVQRAVLDQLMADAVATRLLDSQEKVADAARLLKLSELYDILQGAIWSEVRKGEDVSAMRRNLQREHLRRVAGMLIKPAATTPADARSLQRENALALQSRIAAALRKNGMSKETRAHLNESLSTLSEALKAPLQRTAV